MYWVIEGRWGAQTASQLVRIEHAHYRDFSSKYRRMRAYHIAQILARIKFGGCKNISGFKIGGSVQDRHTYYMRVGNFGGF